MLHIWVTESGFKDLRKKQLLYTFRSLIHYRLLQNGKQLTGCDFRSRVGVGGEDNGQWFQLRDPASRRKRWKGKSQHWDSKIRSRVPRDSDPRKTALSRTSSIYNRQIRPLVRESAPQKEDRKFQTVINIWSWSPDGSRHHDLLTDRQSQCALDLDLDLVSAALQEGRRVTRSNYDCVTILTCPTLRGMR
jgi:hypothetical protein